MPQTMRAFQIPRAGASFQRVERPIPQPTPNTVRIKVLACGVCHSDSVVKDGLFPGIEYPRIPGHEVVGAIDALGAGVTNFAVGNKVGVGWHGGYCGQCDNCRRGDFFACVTGQVTGLRCLYGGNPMNASLFLKNHDFPPSTDHPSGPGCLKAVRNASAFPNFPLSRISFARTCGGISR